MPIDSKIIIEKRSEEKIIAGMDFSGWLSDEETISSITSIVGVSEGAEDLTFTNQGISGNQVVFFIEGGTAGIRYPVTITILTSLGQILIGEGPLKVVA
jgi:hypothetical protein